GLGASIWLSSVFIGSKAPLNSSIQLRARGLDDRGPFGNFGLDIGHELLRRPADDVDAESRERFLDVWVIERGRERAIERRNHVLRCVRRRHQAVPGGGVELLD